MIIFGSLPRGTQQTATSLYPYQSEKLSVIFVYGSDYGRQWSDNTLAMLKVFIWNWINLFIVLMAIGLCFIRRLNKLRHDGFISTLIDVAVIFTGGGSMRMDHKLERLLFLIVSVGAFFLNSLCLDATLFPSYLLSQQTIETFQQLYDTNSPIFLAESLAKQEKLIIQMLRLDFARYSFD